MRTCIDIRLSQTRITAANQYNYGHPATAIHVSTSSIICLLLLFVSSLVHVPVANAGSSPPNTIPRSTNHHRTTFSDPAGVHAGDGPAPLSYPPWTPSSQIDDDGFLKCRYTLLPGEWEGEANIGGRHGPTSKRYRTLHHVPVAIRQVPGDGNCLFHSIATCLAYAANGTHVCMRDPSDLVAASRTLRAAAVGCLDRNARRRLFLQGDEFLRAGELVTAAAAQYDLTAEEYCDQMRRDSYWGGGPEIVALCNVLRRPIHVYELCAAAEVHPDEMKEEEEEDGARGENKKQRQQQMKLRGSANPHIPTSDTFRLRRMACFGSPRFDRREPLHILSADSRFPDIQPGKHQSTGNHFLALFPDPHGEVASFVPKPARARVRGGGGDVGAAGDRSVTAWGGFRRQQREDVADAGNGKRGSSGVRKSKRKRGRITEADESDEDGASLWDKCTSRMCRLLDWD